MSERLERELNKLKYANLKKISDTEYLITKEDGIRIIENKYYLFEVDSRLRNSNNIYAINWNKSNFPKCIYYQAIVEKVLGNMIKILGAGCNDESFKKIEDNFNGWLPIEMLKVLKEV